MGVSFLFSFALHFSSFQLFVRPPQTTILPSWISLVAKLVKNPPAMWETWVQFLGWEDPLEKGKATHSNILAWGISWTIQFQRIARRDKKAFLSDQCKEIEETNRIGKTRDLFKKIRDTKGTFQAKMGLIKDRNGMDLTEAEI